MSHPETHIQSDIPNKEMTRSNFAAGHLFVR